MIGSDVIYFFFFILKKKSVIQKTEDAIFYSNLFYVWICKKCNIRTKTKCIEKNIKNNNDDTDRYGGYYAIYDEDERIMKTRYTDFPWKKPNNYKVNSKVIEI